MGLVRPGLMKENCGMVIQIVCRYFSVELTHRSLTLDCALVGKTSGREYPTHTYYIYVDTKLEDK